MIKAANETILLGLLSAPAGCLTSDHTDDDNATQGDDDDVADDDTGDDDTDYIDLADADAKLVGSGSRTTCRAVRSPQPGT